MCCSMDFLKPDPSVLVLLRLGLMTVTRWYSKEESTLFEGAEKEGGRAPYPAHFTLLESTPDPNP